MFAERTSVGLTPVACLPRRRRRFGTRAGPGVARPFIRCLACVNGMGGAQSHARATGRGVRRVRPRATGPAAARGIGSWRRRAAAAVLEASLRALARSWHRVRTRIPTDTCAAGSTGGGVVRRRDRDARALLDLTPSSALAAPLLYEERTDAEAADALGWRVDKVRNRMERVLGRVPSAEALADRLRVLAEQLPEAEFAASSWAGAWDDLRRRRRTLRSRSRAWLCSDCLPAGLSAPAAPGARTCSRRRPQHP